MGINKLVEDNSFRGLPRAFGVQEFGELLEKGMQSEPEEKTKTSFSPSRLGYAGSCPRRWFYAFQGAEFAVENDPLKISLMRAGSDAGVRLANVLESAGILVEAEREAALEDPPIRGFIDAIVEWKGSEIPVEIKTTRNETWNRRFNENHVPGYQLIQLLIYMHIMQVDKGFFITENKNDHRLFIYPVKMNENNQKFVDDVFDWMRTVVATFKEGELPKRPFNKSSIQCKGCEVRETCWDGWTRGKVNGTDPNPGTVDLPVLEVPK